MKKVSHMSMTMPGRPPFCRNRLLVMLIIRPITNKSMVVLLYSDSIQSSAQNNLDFLLPYHINLNPKNKYFSPSIQALICLVMIYT